MGLITNIKNGVKEIREAVQLKRSLDHLASIYDQKAVSHEPNFFDLNQTGYMSTAAEVFGLTDSEVSPMDIYDMINKDVYFSGLFEQLIEALFKNDFYIEVKKDKNGKLLGSEEKARELEKRLKEIGYLSLVEKQVYGERADGGGNVLLFTTKVNGKLEFRAEPFVDMGKPRVRVYGDDRLRRITKYEVIDSIGNQVFEILPEKNYFLHTRYRNSGDYRFSNNPAKKAVYWYILKKYLAGSNLATFKNGLQEPVIGSPDYSALTHLVNAMGEGKVAGQDKAEYLKNPLAFLAKQSVLDDEILRSVTGDARNTNMFFKLRMPYVFQKVGRSNTNMQTIELINLCDEQMGYALRTSRGVLNTKDSKYSNAEIEADNWSDFVLNPLKKKIEDVTENFYLPALDPEFTTDIFSVRFGRDPDAEDIEIYNAKTARNKSISEILSTLNGVPTAKYNFETNEIEPIEVDEKPKDKPGEANNAADDIVEETDRSVDQIEDYFLNHYLPKQSRESFEERRDSVYKKYTSTVNMTGTEIAAWSKGECSAKASLNRQPIERNIKLLTTPKDKWTEDDIKEASRTIAFIARMRKNLGGKTILKDSTGATCGTKAQISLKNWGFDATRRDPSEALAEGYNIATKKAEIASKKKVRATKTISEQAIESGDYKKFEKLIASSISKQIDRYCERIRKYDDLEDVLSNMAEDFPAISSVGLNVATLKSQLLKFVRLGIEEFEKASGEKRLFRAEDDFEYPEDLLDIIDTKSQLIVKGWSTLNQVQQDLIETYFPHFKKNGGYKGIDAETSGQINTIIRTALDEQVGLDTVIEKIQSLKISQSNQDMIDYLDLVIQDAKNNGVSKLDLIPSIKDFAEDIEDEKLRKKFDAVIKLLEDDKIKKKNVYIAIQKIRDNIGEISAHRAKVIAQTETSQGVEFTRYKLYSDNGYNEKTWDTVNDSKVRESHRDNERAGWIPIDEEFPSGAQSPADEIECRCTVRYRKSIQNNS